MNKAILIGNLCRPPELRTIQNGTPVCTFTIAVQKYKPDADGNSADFFRITASRQLGENCAKYLDQGKKVCVIGPVSCRAYAGKDGAPRASLEVTADSVEFLTPRESTEPTTHPVNNSVSADARGFVQVDDDELPF